MAIEFAGKKSDRSIEYTLIDAEQGIDVGEFTLTSDDVGVASECAFSVEGTHLKGGRQDGCCILTIHAGALKVTVVPTRGMSILNAWLGDVRLGWDSPVKEVINPAYMRLGDRGGLGWLEGFNEFLVRCGSEWTGHPCEDEGILYTLHGRLGNIPASKVTVSVEINPPYTIRVTGVIREQVFKLANLETHASVEIIPGEKHFTVRDTTINQSDYEHPFGILYHTNFGPPILGAGAKFFAAAEAVAPLNADAVSGLDTWREYLGPTRGFGEQVYVVQLRPNEAGQAVAAIVNADQTLGAAMRFSTKELPTFALWKNTDTLKEGYVTGLEPGTNLPYARKIEESKGRLKLLKPGEVNSRSISIEVLEGEDSIKQLLAEINALSSNVGLNIIKDPVFC